jgi:hypothetical protein
MPCNSDYMNPTVREQELQRTAKLLAYVLEQLGEPVPAEVRESAADVYGMQRDYVPVLCRRLQGLSLSRREEIVYNARDKTARDLADWWEEHKAADAAREKAEAAAVRNAKVRESAMAKLTKAERYALGL